MANQNNLSLTRQETYIRFGLQASHVVCKDANNPTIEQTHSDANPSFCAPSIILSTLHVNKFTVGQCCVQESI